MKSRRQRWIGVWATILYTFPLSVSVLTYAAHDVYHVREHLGLVEPELAATIDADAEGFVHAHGGAEHSHDRATDALLGASERTDEPADEHHAPTLERSGHVPSHVSAFAPTEARVGTPFARSRVAVPVSPPPPPLPPPRA